MWARLTDILTMTPEYRMCYCAEDSVPGHPLLSTP